MGVLPEREWIMRAPTLRRKLALTAKVQDEVGHAQLLYRVAEDLGKPREAMLDDLLAGKTKFHNVFHYPTRSWGDIGIIAWLVDAAAIVAQQALRDSSYGPYARTMQKICWEESVHIMHGRDVVVTLMTGTASQRELVQEALNRWWGPLMQMHGPRGDRAKDRDLHWRIKAKTSEELRQEFLTIYVPRLLELGLTIPDPELRFDDDGEGLALHRARLGRAPLRRHRPRPEVAGAARVPPAQPRGDALGSGDGLRPRARPAAALMAVADAAGRRAGGRTRCSSRRRTATRCATAATSWRPTPSWRCTTPGRCSAGATRAPGCGWSAARTSPVLEDPDLLDPPLDRSFKKPGGYVMRDKLAAARAARPARPKPKARDAMTAAAARRSPPPATRAALAELLLTMADDEFVSGFTDSEWTGIAPLLEEDVAISSIAQDELGHAAPCTSCSAELVDDGRDEDALAYDREPDEYRHARLLDHGRGDWATRSPGASCTSSPTRRGSRRSADGYRPAGRARREAPARGALPPHARRGLDRAAGPGRGRAARPAGRRARSTLGLDAATVFTPLEGEAALLEAGILARAMAEPSARGAPI